MKAHLINDRLRGIKSGFFSEKTVQGGPEITRKVHRHILFGGKCGFEYGKLREVVKAIAAGQGWKFMGKPYILVSVCPEHVPYNM